MKITLRIYLKSSRKPFTVDLSSKKQLNSFYDMLRMDNIVSIGPLTFDRNEYLYSITTSIEE